MDVILDVTWDTLFIDPKEKKGHKIISSLYSRRCRDDKNALNNKSIESFCPITTMDLAEWVQDKLTPDMVLEKLNEKAKIYLYDN